MYYHYGTSLKSLSVHAYSFCLTKVKYVSHVAYMLTHAVEDNKIINKINIVHGVAKSQTRLRD